MTYTLDVYLYRDDNRADTPIPAGSDAELDELLEYALTTEQPHPTQIIARERPRVGPLQRPDHLVKVDLRLPQRVGAILYLSPDAWTPVPEDADRPVVWVTKTDTPPHDAPGLFIDRPTERTFPADAVLPFDLVREALHEFRRTGERPTCVDWQPAPNQIY